MPFEDAWKSEFAAVDVPGMELGALHKYAFNILMDHMLEEGLERPGPCTRLCR